MKLVLQWMLKGSLSAVEASKAVQKGLERSNLSCKVYLMPLADGGDGTLEVMLSQRGSRRYALKVHNPLDHMIEAAYGLLADRKTAVIEMALASGLALLGENRDAMKATTYGTGELIQHAIQVTGAKRIIIGVGGSATVDGGAGCMQALGVDLQNASGKSIPFGGGTLDQLAQVKLNPALDDVEILVLCDVDNPPLGEKGAAQDLDHKKGLPQNKSKFSKNS